MRAALLCADLTASGETLRECGGSSGLDMPELMSLSMMEGYPMPWHVYRIEDEDGQGPWTSVNGLSLVDAYEEGWSVDPSDMPTPHTRRDDVDAHLSQKDVKGRGVFGFPSKQMLRRWFCWEAREYLEKQGFTVGIYEISDDVPLTVAARNNDQAVFRKSHATLIARVGLFELT